jgi:hypothetical protein
MLQTGNQLSLCFRAVIIHNWQWWYTTFKIPWDEIGDVTLCVVDVEKSSLRPPFSAAAAAQQARSRSVF